MFFVITVTLTSLTWDDVLCHDRHVVVTIRAAVFVEEADGVADLVDEISLLTVELGATDGEFLHPLPSPAYPGCAPTANGMVMVMMMKNFIYFEKIRLHLKGWSKEWLSIIISEITVYGSRKVENICFINKLKDFIAY